MSDRNGFDRPALSAPMFVQAYLPAAALAGVRARRIVALVFDLVFVSVLAFALWLALAVLTFGFSLFILPPLFPIVTFFTTASQFRVIGWRRRGCGRWTSKCV